MGVGTGEGAAPPRQPKNMTIEKNELLSQHQDTAIIKRYSAGEYDINETLKTSQK